MLSIEDIKNASFRRANFGGYKPEDVDAFIDDIQVSFEEMIREKEELKSTVKMLNDKIEKFYEEDNSIRNVILNAQKIAEKSLSEAKTKTVDMINVAAEQSQQMINKAKKEVSVHTEIINRLKTESVELKKQLEDIYKKHLKLIGDIPGNVSDLKENSKIVTSVIDKTKTKLPEDESSVMVESNVKSEMVDISGQACGGADCKSVTENIFSSDELEGSHDKFKNLEFGKNVNEMKLDSKESDFRGAYLGLFRKK